ncbi:sodium/substrate symporter small subunit [Undibacterium sp.]|jgi:putative solute:sodium symporter small subunit|uniref:DUF4212 domain-containing protein n=1 Tax=Undibacterium sp. TaxID=1914977 RepID=UPI002C9BFC27|nr:sodium/substrate symporter small subunit [Undibacterium sp.]HTD06927.1 sodium/substrate symporter small subunit [Undibacterium sp.]
MDNSADREAIAQAPARSPCWPSTRRLSVWLLASWLALTFGTLFFARELSGIYFFGWSLPFYMAAQGLSLFYVLILAVYSLAMRRIENSRKGKA